MREKIEVINPETGEILDKSIIDEIKKKEYLDRRKYLTYMLENKPELLSSVEIEEAVSYTDKQLKSIRQYVSFDKYFTANKQKLDNSLDVVSDQAFKCFNILVARYTSCENTIQFKNSVNIVRNKDFTKALNISDSKWCSIKKELTENNWIRKVKFQKESLYKINPMIIGHSMRITKCTYYAFRNEFNFDRVKKLYWDKQLIEEFGVGIFTK